MLTFDECVLLSIRLNSTAVRKLLNETGASSIIVSSRTAGQIEDAAQQNAPVDQFKATTYKAVSFTLFLEASLGPTEFLHLPQCQQYVREDDQNVIILHSSGTTGMLCALLARRMAA